MKPERYTKILRRYVDENFSSQKEAAAFFECSPSTMCLVLMGERTPTDRMIQESGYEYEVISTRNYKRAK